MNEGAWHDGLLLMMMSAAVLPLTFSPDGCLFCKTCIYKNLLAQKEELERKMAAWEVQNAKQQREEAEKAQKEAAKGIVTFLEGEEGITTAGAAKGMFRLQKDLSSLKDDARLGNAKKVQQALDQKLE